MRFLLPILALLYLAGCAPERLNPGAERVLQRADGIWLATTYQVANGAGIDPTAIGGLFDTSTGAITIRRAPVDQQVAETVHEVGEALAYELGPRVWEIIDRYASPAFPCGHDGLHGHHPQAATARLAGH
jgi:hypothetical protein